MTVYIKELEQMRREWVEVTRKNGFRDGITDLLAHQYSEKTHFIFELLQNAEDAKASEVEFLVENERLVFSHNGELLFTDENVKSITSIGQSSKRTDYTQIGKHGIGFKSVFAYTHTPRIHSGDKHFDIVDVVVPHILTGSDIPADIKFGETRIVLPFDSEALPEVRRFRELVPTEKARTDISGAMRQLSARTLLFLRHIKKIHWTLPDSTNGACLRDKPRPVTGRPTARYVDIMDGSKTEKENWLVFERKITIADEGKEHQGTVEVAFLIQDDKVIRARNTELVVFFPTEKKTELGFLIQGPFKTTKARDNIAKSQDCEANKQLIETAEQVAADSLEILRDLNLLDISSYHALPLQVPEDSFFRPVYDRVRKSLKEKPLIPLHGGGLGKPDEAKLARGKELVALFSSEQLGMLFGKEKLSWLDSSITETGTFADVYTYLVGRKKQWRPIWEIEPLLDGLQVDGDTLSPKLTASFLGRQPLAWLIKFIQYAAQGSSALKRTQFIRLVSGKQVSLPADRETPRPAWFAPKDAVGLDLSVFPLVDSELAVNDDVRKFLEKEGIREIDAVAIVEKSILPKYQEANLCFDESTYRVDLRRICEAYSKANDSEKAQLSNSLNKYRWLACVHASGNAPDKIVWKEPGASDLFEKTADHETWFDGLEDVSAYFLHSSVIEALDGAVTSLAKTTTALTMNLSANEYTISLSNKYSNHKHGLKGFNPNATIVGIESALANWNCDKSMILWNALLSAPLKIICGETQSATNRQKLGEAQKKIEYTKVGELCRNQAWLPDKSGNWRKPSELQLADLPNGFESTSIAAKELSVKLGMKQSVDLHALGMTQDQFENRIRLTDEEVNEALKRRSEACKFPDKKSNSPDRRREKVRGKALEAPKKTSLPKKQSVQDGYAEDKTEAKEYLHGQYTDDDGNLFCQVAHKPMPFKLIDSDEWHFEAVECVPDAKRRYPENFLALSPHFAALYKYANHDKDRMRDQILKAESLKIPIKLANETYTLRFTSQHLDDLKTVLQVDVEIDSDK